MSGVYQKIRKIAVAVIAAALLIPACIQNVAAAPPDYSSIGLDSSREVSLSLTFEYSDKDVKTPISGAEFTVYQVAVLGTDGNYTMLPAYQGAGCPSFGDIQSASEMAAAAKQYQNIAQSGQDAGRTAVAGSDGSVDFGFFSPEQYGVYLVVETNRSGVAQKYTTADPFLLQIPEVGADGEWIYAVTAQPKTSVEKKNIPTTPPPKTPPRKPPKAVTGDRSKVWIWIWMGTIAVLCMAGLLMFRKRRD